MNRNGQGGIYAQIIDRIIEAAKNDFEEGGYDQSTLMELKEVSRGSAGNTAVVQIVCPVFIFISSVISSVAQTFFAVKWLPCLDFSVLPAHVSLRSCRVFGACGSGAVALLSLEGRPLVFETVFLYRITWPLTRQAYHVTGSVWPFPSLLPQVYFHITVLHLS